MPPLAEVHLVSDADYLPQAITLQVIALFDHPADPREAYEAPRLRTPQGVALKMRHDGTDQVAERSSLVLEGSIGLRPPDPATSEVGLQILEQYTVSLV